MTDFVNDRDVIIANTVPPYYETLDRALLLAATAQTFAVAVTTIASPTSITYTATLLNMEGTVNFSASDGSTLVITGNTAVLNYSGMATNTCTVTASIVVEGLTYTASATANKVFDGVTGNSSRVAFSKTSLSSLSPTPATITTAGNASFPPADTWGAGTVWGGSPPAFTAGESLYRSDGIFNPASGTTTWAAPYLNALKVGQLSAITADLGKVTAGELQSVVLHGGSGYPHNTYTWPTNGGIGYHLSSAGLLLGNEALGQYFQVTGAGAIFAPGLAITGGNAVFSGSLQAATGTFSLIRSPARLSSSSAAGYDLTGTGIYFYDGVHANPYIELGEYIT